VLDEPGAVVGDTQLPGQRSGSAADRAADRPLQPVVGRQAVDPRVAHLCVLE
jgi:hypothetical protein